MTDEWQEWRHWNRQKHQIRSHRLSSCVIRGIEHKLHDSSSASAVQQLEYWRFNGSNRLIIWMMSLHGCPSPPKQRSSKWFSIMRHVVSSTDFIACVYEGNSNMMRSLVVLGCARSNQGPFYLSELLLSLLTFLRYITLGVHCNRTWNNCIWDIHTISSRDVDNWRLKKGRMI